MRSGGLTLESELRVWAMNPESTESTCENMSFEGLGSNFREKFRCLLLKEGLGV